MTVTQRLSYYISASTQFQGNPQGNGTLGPISYDQKHGLGNVPHNQEVGYRGLVCLMTPRQFLGLLPPWVETSDDDTRSANIGVKLKGGAAIGSPFLVVDFRGSKSVRVVAHEGRHRSRAITDLYGNIPMLVHIFSAQLPAKHLPIERIELFRQKAKPEGQDRVKNGPWFEPRIWFRDEWITIK